MAVHKLAILVEALGTAEANRKLKGVDSTISNIGARANKGVRTAAGNIARLGVVAGGVAAAGLAFAVKSAGDFESQLNTINTVAQLSATDLSKVGDGIRKMARDTGTSLGDLSTAYYDLVSAGISTADAQNVLTAANTLAIGGLATTAQTVDLLTTAINSYGGDATQAAKYADEFAVAIRNGKVTADQIASSFSRVGPLAAKYGIGVDEIAAAYGQLTATGVPAAEVATDFRSALKALAKPTTDLKKLEKQTGKSYIAIAGKKGLVAALEQMRKDADKTGIPMVDLIGRMEGLNFAAITTGSGFDTYNKNLTEVQNGTGTAAQQMSEKQQGLNYQMSRLKALALDAAITIGNKLLPKITPLAERAVKFLDSHQADISAFGDKIAAGFDKALAFAEKIPWDAIGTGLQTAADWAGKLMDVFLSMPPGVQSSIIALAGLNKLSGGAISGIVGELGKGLIKGVLGINAGVVNVRGAVVNGGGGGGGGLISKAAGAAGGASAVGAGLALGGATLALGAGAVTLYDIIPSLFANMPKHPGGEQAALGGKHTQTLVGPNAAMVRLFTPIARASYAKLPTAPKANSANERRAMEATFSRKELQDISRKQEALRTATLETKAATERADQRQQAKLDAFKSSNATALHQAQSGISSSMITGSQSIVNALRNYQPKTIVNVTTSVTSARVQKATHTQTSYGPGNGSSGGGHHNVPHGATI